MENENNQEAVKAENVPAPTEPSSAPQSGAMEGKPSSPAPETVAETSPAEPSPTPEPILTPEPSPTPEPIKPTPPLEPSPISSPALSSGSAVSTIKNLLLRAKAKIQFRKRAKLEKIMSLAQSKSKITNNDIEKLLRVSDKTAERYLGQLVKEGKLVRQGKPKNAFYILP